MLTSKDRIALIRERIVQKIQPEKLQIIDESQAHVGHAGASTGAGHFAVIIRAEAFQGKSLVDSHRMIYDAIGDAMGSEIHALRIKIEK